MYDRSGWYPCSLHFLICTTDLPQQLQAVRPRVQPWVQAERLDDFKPYASDASSEAGTPESSHVPVPEVSSLLPPRHACCSDLRSLDLEWQPPQTKAQLGHWGSSMRDWSIIFHFWIQWCNAEPSLDTRNWSWSEVTALFLSQGGQRADFCAGCDTWAQLIWKMRILSSKLLNDCLYGF